MTTRLEDTWTFVRTAGATLGKVRGALLRAKMPVKWQSKATVRSDNPGRPPKPHAQLKTYSAMTSVWYVDGFTAKRGLRPGEVAVFLDNPDLWKYWPKALQALQRAGYTLRSPLTNNTTSPDEPVPLPADYKGGAIVVV